MGSSKNVLEVPPVLDRAHQLNVLGDPKVCHACTVNTMQIVPRKQSVGIPHFTATLVIHDAHVMSKQSRGTSESPMVRIGNRVEAHIESPMVWHASIHS